jgi:anthranilate phosphoribosyltransferase
MNYNFKETLQNITLGNDLSTGEAMFALESIMNGEVSSEEIASFLTAMKMKGETIEELSSFVKVMRSKSLKVQADITGAVDIVGTGGDKSGTFNISTITAFVTAAAGVPVIKHGNRSASSKCGSADVLEILGANIELNPEQVAQVFERVGIAFMYAPMFHPAMKYVMPARKAIGFRTFFNILGPLTNPAGVRNYVIGAYNKDVAHQMAQILATLNTQFAYTFSSEDGLDEISLCNPTTFYEVKEQQSSQPRLFEPEELGFNRVTISELLGGEPTVNARIFTDILSNKATNAQTNMVILNAAFAIQAVTDIAHLQEAKKNSRRSHSLGCCIS